MGSPSLVVTGGEVVQASQQGPGPNRETADRNVSKMKTDICQARPLREHARIWASVIKPKAIAVVIG